MFQMKKSNFKNKTKVLQEKEFIKGRNKTKQFFFLE